MGELDDVSGKDVLKGFALVMASLAAILVIMFAVQGTNFFLYKWFGPKTEQVRRETFEQSKAYNDGMVQELSNMQFEYVQAKPEQQKALASIILHRAANYDVNRLPPDLKKFVEDLRRERTGGK